MRISDDFLMRISDDFLMRISDDFWGSHLIIHSISHSNDCFNQNTRNVSKPINLANGATVPIKRQGEM